ncbi:MAG: TatD family hydrolase [Opitutaceae bacterium]
MFLPLKPPENLFSSTNPSAIAKEADNRGVAYIAAVGSNEASSASAKSFAEALPHAWFAAGVHPHEASTFKGDLSPFQQIAQDEKFVAIGEIGLDYFYENSDKPTQIKTLQHFLALAHELNAPAIIHCRDKWEKSDAYASIPRWPRISPVVGNTARP